MVLYVVLVSCVGAAKPTGKAVVILPACEETFTFDKLAEPLQCWVDPRTRALLNESRRIHHATDSRVHIAFRQHCRDALSDDLVLACAYCAAVAATLLGNDLERSEPQDFEASQKAFRQACLFALGDAHTLSSVDHPCLLLDESEPLRAYYEERLEPKPVEPWDRW
jgi:hypothetical protein